MNNKKPDYKEVNDFFKHHRSPKVRGGQMNGEQRIFDYLYGLFQADQFGPYKQENLVVPPTIRAQFGTEEYRYVRVDVE